MRQPPRSTGNDTRFPYTTLCRSERRQARDRVPRVAGDAAVDDRVGEHDTIAAGGRAGERDRSGRRVARDRCEADRTGDAARDRDATRSEEHTSELQSLMRISYAVFCLKKKITL